MLDIAGQGFTRATRYDKKFVFAALLYVIRVCSSPAAGPSGADEAAHWDRLHEGWIVGRINHSEAYSADGANTNAVESFFSRLRRMVEGQHHMVSPKYLHQYSAHAAWLEDHRRRSNGANAVAAINNAMHHKVSTVWCGYWQRAERKAA